MALSAILRFCSLFVFRSFLHPQTWEFGQIARSVATGHGFTYFGPYLPSAYMPPAYPLILAGALSLFGENSWAYLALGIIQAVLGVLLVYFVYLLTLTLYSNQRTAQIAAICAALYPPLIEMCDEFHSISFYVVLGVGAVLFLERAVRYPDRWSYLIYSAICMGTLLLFRAEAVIFIPVYATFLLRRHHRISVLRPIVFVLVSYLFLVPWAMRNQRLFHQFVPTTTSAGINLWIGNNPNASGSDRGDSKYISPELQVRLDAIPKTAEYEIQRDRFLKQAAISYMVSHPQHEIALDCKKLFMFWCFDPKHEKGRLPTYWVPSVLLSIIAVSGLFIKPRLPFKKLSVILITVSFSVVLALIFFSLPRYKIAIDPYLCILAANRVAFLLSSRNAAGVGAY